MSQRQVVKALRANTLRPELDDSKMDQATKELLNQMFEPLENRWNSRKVMMEWKALLNKIMMKLLESTDMSSAL